MLEIGLKRGTVVLREYDPEWAHVFELEKSFLVNLLGKDCLAIEHIGSTAVPGLAAKPIIDMLMGVRSLADVSELSPVLEKNGYEYRENGSDDKQVLFVKGPEEKRTHYLHIMEFGGPMWRNDLAFRDYLRTHPEAAVQYQSLKQELASKYKDDRTNYTKGKEDFIGEILAKTTNKE